MKLRKKRKDQRGNNLIKSNEVVSTNDRSLKTQGRIKEKWFDDIEIERIRNAQKCKYQRNGKEIKGRS